MTAAERFREAACIGQFIVDELERYQELVGTLVAEYAPSERDRKRLLGDLAHHATGARCSTQLVKTIAARTDGLSSNRLIELRAS